jgi:alpha-1,3-glucosyltransferase
MKWSDKFSIDILAKLSLILTLLFSLPSTISLILNPKKSTFLLALFNVSMAFYFFSFHVHEKTILFPMAMCLLNIRKFGLYFVDFTALSIFTMYHLLKENKLQMQYVSLSLVYLYFAEKII